MTNDIKLIKGKLFTSNSQTLVNTVNCVGIMGAGIALEFKYRYPEMFSKYVKYCKDKLINIGKLWIYEVPSTQKKVLNFPTKNHWKQPSKYEYLEKGLERFVNTYKEKNVYSIAFPLLGAQNGGLNPDKVLDLMYQYLCQCDIPIEIYEYDDQAPDDLFHDFKKIFLHDDFDKIEKLTHFQKNTIYIIKKVIEDNNFNSLIQLHKIPGIGEETLKECFRVAMHNKSAILDYNMYTKVNVPVKDYVHESKQINLFQEHNNDVTGIELSVVEKMKLTGLKKATIQKIDKGQDEVSIKDLKLYCNALNLNFMDFVNRQYAFMQQTA